MGTRAMTTRRGSLVVLMAIMMVVLLGMVAFAVDIGYITTTRSELQTVADSAALAGASKLIERSILIDGATQEAAIRAAREEAQRFGLANRAGGKPIFLELNPDNTTEGSIVVGRFNPSAPDAPLVHSGTFANAVQVTARRTHDENGALNLFFGGILGKRTAEVWGSATASFTTHIQGFEITGRNPEVTNSNLLPFAMDVEVWKDIIEGIGPDEWTINPATGKPEPGMDGIKEAKLYGATKLTTANFGTINIGKENNSTSDIVRQILYGPNKSDFDAMGGKFELGPDGTRVVSGDPGLSAGFKDALAEIRGKPRIIPLYREVWGVGSNAKYMIVGFAGVTITEVRLTGRDKAVTIQPEVVVDPTVIPGEPTTTTQFKTFVFGPMSIVR